MKKLLWYCIAFILYLPISVDCKASFRKRKDEKSSASLSQAMVTSMQENSLTSLNITNSFSRPNILLILADDLGYGDTSVPPFTIEKGPRWPCDEGGILTPELEKMASNGVILTNFHSAAPVCSPARAAIMTGLYSYRLNALNAFELGRDLSQRNGFLPQVPTGAELFKEAGYFTAHSGKWHLGGMREEYRKARLAGDCSRPGPNQHGFDEYVSMLDGPQSPRYTFLNRDSILHSQGHNYLIRNDKVLPNNKTTAVLSDVEAGEAIRMMREHAAKETTQPWFMQVWFNAPHGPWEILPTGQHHYEVTMQKDQKYFENIYCDRAKEPLLKFRTWKYKTMITAMDRSIGMLLRALKELHIENNTLVVFTSDNGWERGAGTAGVFLEGKRSLMEGGVRVPCIIQWPGVIPANESISTWSAQTDLLPTFLEAAEVSRPTGLKFDGMSLLGLLKQKTKRKAFHSSTSKVRRVPLELHKRLYLWHRDTEPFDGHDGRVNSAGIFENIKLITRQYTGQIYKIFDLKTDPTERKNMIIQREAVHNWIDFNNFQTKEIGRLIRTDTSKIKCIDNSTSCITKYNEHTILKIKFIMLKLSKFVRYGNEGHRDYMKHREKKAICKVPIASEIPILNYGSVNCTACSYPEL